MIIDVMNTRRPVSFYERDAASFTAVARAAEPAPRDLKYDFERRWQTVGGASTLRISALEHGVLVGIAVVSPDTDGRLVCTDLFVDERHRRRGVGTGMIDLAERSFSRPVHPGNDVADAEDFWIDRLRDVHPDILAEHADKLGHSTFAP